MTSLSSQKQNGHAHGIGSRARGETTWSDIDKSRLYGIGTVMYSVLTVALHPLTVTKIRRQVLTNNSSSTTLESGSFFQTYYRGLSVVVSLAIPARIIYISTLEFTRELIDTHTRQLIFNPPLAMAAYEKELQSLIPFVTPFSGGIAGGVAAVSSQAIIVPMDVVSQKLMVMEYSKYREKGSALNVVNSIIRTEGYGGLFRGFGLSLFTSIPAGSIWWAAYAGVKDQLNQHLEANYSPESMPVMARQGIIQITSAFSAAFASSILTQPLDTIKTRIQVSKGKPSFFSPLSIAKELTSTSGLYKGLMPRMCHMGVWGSVLSAAYEYLKFVSRKDYNNT